MSDYSVDDYKIYYVHQQDTRSFNRGAIKNIGFLAMKSKYPNDYKNITFVFNDVDTMPYTKNFLNYETTDNVVKHFYGYKFALGGIVSIKGSDFERIGGFPNFWAWGYEDNVLNLRVLAAGIHIDRTQFYPIMDKNIFQLKDGMSRVVNRNEFDQFIKNTSETMADIHNISFEINEDTQFVNVSGFLTKNPENLNQMVDYDLRKGIQPFKPLPQARRGRPTMRLAM